MGIRAWWAERRRKRELSHRSHDYSFNERIIADVCPEVAGMGFVQGAAYVLRAVDEFNVTATREHSIELVWRLAASEQSWKSEGMIMPWYGNLIVLRELQADIAAGHPLETRV